MSSDAKGMLEVNRDLILRAAREARSDQVPGMAVISAATWGRGNQPERLATLRKWQRFSGFNSSIVAAVPIQEGLGDPELKAILTNNLEGGGPTAFLAVGLAFGKSHWEWWNYDGTENLPELF